MQAIKNKFCKQGIKKFIVDLFFTFLSFVRILKRIRKFSPNLPCSCENSKIFVLGNGPSLSENLANQTFLFQNTDCICVNCFADSAFFEVIKPKYYLLLDPIYWREGCLQMMTEERERVFSNIKTKTTWPIILLLPNDAKVTMNWSQIFQENKNISVTFFNSLPLKGLKYFVFNFYRMNLGMPPAQNVLVAAIFLSINMAYDKIFVCGADHSWHEDLAVNQENVVCLKDRHFYDSTEPILRPWYKGGADGETWKMHEILAALGRMFEGYQELEEYSRYRNVEVFNCTKHSYIDSFKRHFF